MAGNDVRIRLSPEGIAEVTAALRKVEREAKRTNKSAETGLAGIRKQVGQIRGAVAGIGLSAASIGLAGLGRNALTFADQIGEVSERVGVTTENLSALAVAARFVGIELPTLQNTFSRLPQVLDELQRGTGSSVAAFQALQLTAEDFTGLSVAQSLELIAERMAALPQSTRKVQLAVDLFGKSGAALIPLLDKLGTEGFGGLRANAAGLGVLVSQEFADAAGATNDAVDLMILQLQGLSNQFLTGFLPSVLTAFNDFQDTVKKDGQEPVREFGEDLGRLFRIAAAVFSGLVDLVVDFGTVFINNIKTPFQVLTEAIENGPAAAMELLKQRGTALGGEFVTLFSNIKNNAAAVADAITTPADAPPQPNRPGAGGPIPKTPAELAAEARKQEAGRLAAVRSGLADEASIRDAAAARQAQSDRRAYDLGLISLQQYIERRRQAVRAGLEGEVAALRAELSAVESGTGDDAVKRAADVASLRAQITVREIQAAQELDALDAERIDRERAAATERLQVQQQLAEAEGRKADAARIALELQSEALRQQLTTAGATRAEVDALVSRFQQASETRTNFEATLAQAESAFASLDAARTRIEQDVQLGITTQLGGQQRILQIEQARLPVLRTIAEAALQAARATGDPAAIEQAEQLALRVREIGVSVELASNSFARFRDQAEQASVNALTDFLDNGILQAKNLKDAFRQLALSVINDLKRIAAQALATTIVRGLSAAFGGGVGGGGGGGGGGGAGGFARGGLLRGAGTGTSDSNLAWLSDGEYVVRAASVRRPGMLKLLESINAGDAPGFARGGLVDIMPRFAEGGLAEAGTTGSFRGRLEIGLADGLEPRSTPISDALIIDVIRRNPRRVGAILR